MAIQNYTKKDWNDDGQPFINATNLNIIDGGIENIYIGLYPFERLGVTGGELSANLNNFKITGFCYTDVATLNMPISGIFNVQYIGNATNGTQIAYNTSTSDVYVRTVSVPISTEVWTPWQLMSSTPTFGYTPFNNSVEYSATGETKFIGEIIIPSGKKKGVANICNTASPFDYNITVHFYDKGNKDRAYVTGKYSSSPSTWTRRRAGFISGSGTSTVAGSNAVGNYVGIRDIYIEDNKIKIEFFNTYSTTRNLNCIVDYEVY